MNLRELYKIAISKLAEAGVESAEAEAKIMLEEISGRDFAWLFLHAENEASVDAIERLGDMMERRKAGEPLQYIIGKTNFMGIDIAVAPGVLVPRPETEGLCELAESEVLSLCGDAKSLRFLDLCTGSGCIAAYLAERFPQSEVSACDISTVALEFARRNCPERVKLFQGDLFGAIPSGEEPYDIIISNPPYIPSGEIVGLDAEVKAWEPAMALDGGEDGMASAACSILPTNLTCKSVPSPFKNRMVLLTSSAYSSGDIKPTHGALQLLFWYSRQGRCRWAKKLLLHWRTLNIFCIISKVCLAAWADGKGPKNLPFWCCPLPRP